MRISHQERSGAGLCDQAVVNTLSCLFCVGSRDPNPKVERLYDSGRDDHMLRVQNFSILNRHLRAFYQVGDVTRGGAGWGEGGGVRSDHQEGNQE